MQFSQVVKQREIKKSNQKRTYTLSVEPNLQQQPSFTENLPPFPLLTWVPLCQTPASSPQMLRGSTSRQHPTEGTKTREFTPPIKQCKKNFHVVDNQRTATKVYQKVQFTCTLRVLCFNYKTLSDLTSRCCCRRI